MGPVGVGAVLEVDVVIVDERLPIGVVVGIAVVDVDEVGTGKLPLIAYILSLLGPPQYSVLLPPQSIEQPSVAGSELV